MCAFERDPACLTTISVLFFQMIVYISTLRGNEFIGLVRVVGIIGGVLVSIFCSVVIMPVSAESYLNEVGMY